jgi:hypothetical protein
MRRQHLGVVICAFIASFTPGTLRVFLAPAKTADTL